MPSARITAQTSASLQSASGLNLYRPNVASCSSRASSARVADCAPLPGDPGAASGQRALERLDLADLAAGLAQLHAFVEGIGAMRGHMRIDGSRVWPVDRDLAAIALADRVQHAQRFGVQPAGVQREHLQVQPGVENGVRQHHVLGRQRRGQRSVGIRRRASASVSINSRQRRRAGFQFGRQFDRRHACTAKIRARRGRASRVSPSRRFSSLYSCSGTSASMMASESWRASSR